MNQFICFLQEFQKWIQHIAKILLMFDMFYYELKGRDSLIKELAKQKTKRDHVFKLVLKVTHRIMKFLEIRNLQFRGK